MAVRKWDQHLTKYVQRRAKADAAAEAAQEDLYAAMLDAFEAGELTYRQIAAVTGLGRERVAQVLRLQREKRGLVERRGVRQSVAS